jgi:hypothetical protein
VSKKEKNEIFEIIENLREVNIDVDFFQVAQETRVSYYYLESLENLFGTHICTSKDYDIEGYRKKIEKISSTKTEYDNLESKVFKISKDYSKKKTCVDIENILNLTKDYIRLKEKIDKLQVEMLDYLLEVDKNLIELYVNKKPELELNELQMQYFLKSLMKSAFYHSTDEDKIINWSLTLFETDLKKEAKKKGIILPVKLKTCDYNYMIQKKRNLYKIGREEFLNLIQESSKKEEELLMKELNKKQFELNKIVKKISIIGIIIAVIGLIYATVSIYFTITNYKTKNIKDNKKIYSTIMEKKPNGKHKNNQ